MGAAEEGSRRTRSSIRAKMPVWQQRTALPETTLTRSVARSRSGTVGQTKVEDRARFLSRCASGIVRGPRTGRTRLSHEDANGSMVRMLRGQ